MSGKAENIVYEGSLQTIEYAVLKSGKMPAREFFYDLSVNDQAKFLVLFRLLCDRGQIRNKELFKKIKGTELFEFKRSKIRFLCFFLADGRIILTHGFIKKSPKTPRREIDRANQIRRTYLT